MVKLLAAGHHGVHLTDEQWDRLNTWIDTNGVYYDRYETYYPNRRLFTGKVEEDVREVYSRRCAACHGEKSDGRLTNWWRSLNQHDVRQSRMLQAPLARAAGGGQRCSPPVFVDQSDVDYQKLLIALRALRDQLHDRPRADLLSLRDRVVDGPSGEQPRRMPPTGSPESRR